MDEYDNDIFFTIDVEELNCCDDQWKERKVGSCGWFVRVITNPFQEELNLELNLDLIGTTQESQINLALYNNYGNIVLTKNLNSNQQFHSIDASSLQNGSYILRVLNSGDLVHSEPVIKI